MRVVGIDPGGASTGVVVRDGFLLLGHHLFERSAFASTPEYLADICRGVRAAYTTTRCELVACEDLTSPTGHLGQINVSGLIGTAKVIGALQLSIADLLLVPPGSHGSHMAQVYPAALIGPNEPKMTGRLRHCRSAWDVAAAATSIHAINNRRKT